jgi:hypothetical protein
MPLHLLPLLLCLREVLLPLLWQQQLQRTLIIMLRELRLNSSWCWHKVESNTSRVHAAQLTVRRVQAIALQLRVYVGQVGN